MVDANANDAIDGDCFVCCPPLSKTKGHPKQKRMKGGKELGKQKRTCGFVSMLAITFLHVRRRRRKTQLLQMVQRKGKIVLQ